MIITVIMERKQRKRSSSNLWLHKPKKALCKQFMRDIGRKYETELYI